MLLPKVSVQDQMGLVSVTPEQHFTQPPPRYTDASLVKELEQGALQPSTYASIIQLLEKEVMSSKTKIAFSQNIADGLPPASLKLL